MAILVITEELKPFERSIYHESDAVSALRSDYLADTFALSASSLHQPVKSLQHCVESTDLPCFQRISKVYSMPGVSCASLIVQANYWHASLLYMHAWQVHCC